MTAGEERYSQVRLPGFCEVCGGELPAPDRSRRGGRGRRYCSDACRQAAYRRRRKLAAVRRAVQVLAPPGENGGG